MAKKKIVKKIVKKPAAKAAKKVEKKAEKKVVKQIVKKTKTIAPPPPVEEEDNEVEEEATPKVKRTRRPRGTPPPIKLVTELSSKTVKLIEQLDKIEARLATDKAAFKAGLIQLRDEDLGGVKSFVHPTRGEVTIMESKVGRMYWRIKPQGPGEDGAAAMKETWAAKKAAKEAGLPWPPSEENEDSED